VALSLWRVKRLIDDLLEEGALASVSRLADAFSVSVSKNVSPLALTGAVTRRRLSKRRRQDALRGGVGEVWMIVGALR